MRIVHLATTHRASDPRIFQKECRTLARAGHEVIFIVPHARTEVVDGVLIKGVPIPSNGKERLTRTVYHVLRKALREDARAVFHFHDSDLLLVMFFLKAIGRRVVYDMHENTPQQILYQHWIPEWLRPAVSAVAAGLERFGSWFFDGLLAAEPVVAERLAPRPVQVVRNYPLLEEFPSPSRPYADRPNRVAYVGAVTDVRGAREMVGAMCRLPDHLAAELVVGGSFHPASLRDTLERLRCAEKVRYLGYLSRDDVRSELAAARVGLVVLHPTDKYLNSYPTKLFEYMAAGIPVVVSDFPLWRPFVEEARCGFLVDPLDEAAIAEAIRWLLENPEEAEAMGSRGRRAVEERYTWEREGEALLAFYDGLASGR